MSRIIDIYAREILDSRGNPTIEVEVTTELGGFGRGMVPSGASTGEKEAVELRDGVKSRYNGKGVEKAVNNVNNILGPKIIEENFDVTDQALIDEFMIELDGTKNKAKYGANAILGISIATAKAAANELGMPIYRYLGGAAANELPMPLFNILNGGCHSPNKVDFQEYKIAPIGAKTFKEALRIGSEIYHTLAGILKADGFSTALGDEGGFAPDLKNNEEPLEYIVKAIKKAGYTPAIHGDDAVAIYLDPAISELDDGPTDDNLYRKYRFRFSSNEVKTTREIIDMYKEWIKKYPIISIEDPLGEHDWAGFKLMHAELGDRLQIMGDDIFVTNPVIVAQGIKDDIANSVLIKINQIGTLSETIKTVQMAQKAGWTTVFSHRSGETEDSFIADFAVALNAGQMKTGAPARSERLSKYNQLLRIEESLGSAAVFPGIDCLYNLKKIKDLK